MHITFEIPGKPHPKGRPRLGKWGAYTPQKTQEYERFAKECFLKAAKEKGWEISEQPLSVCICASYVRAKTNKDEYATAKADVDNIAKSVLDALNGVAYKDDRQIIQLQIDKLYSHTDRVLVRIDELEGEDDDEC